VERLGEIALILSELDLHDIERVVLEPTMERVRGSRLEIRWALKALVVKRLRQIPSDRELYRRLWDDPMLREIYNIED